MLKIIVAGGRDFTDYTALCLAVEGRIALKGIVPEIVNGMCPTGADLLARQYASKLGFKVIPFPANWNLLGARAGPCRNKQMAEYADVLIAFWDGKSAGTSSMIMYAMSEGLEVHVYRY